MTSRRMTTLAVAFVAWLVVAGGAGLVALPVDPAGAATADAGGAPTDRLASRLGAGDRLAPSGPAPAGPQSVAAPQGSTAVALAMALGMLQAQYISPTPRIWPEVDGMQVIELETWLAIDPSAFRNHRGWGISGSVWSGIVTVRASATAARTIWRFTDRTVICDGPGVEWVPGAVGPAPCGRYFEHTTSVGPNNMEVFIQYDVEWTSSTGASGSLVMTSGSVGSYPLAIGEIQGVGTEDGGELVNGPGGGPGGEAPSSESGDSCGFLMALYCGARDAVEWFAEEVIWDNLPPEVQWVLQQIWSFLEGCAAFIGEVFSNAFDMLRQLGDAITDPEKFIREKWLVAKAIYEAIEEAHANGELLEFAREVFGDIIEEDLLRSDPAQWIGKFGCELAVGILTGGAAAGSGRLARLINRTDDLLDRISLWRRGRRGRDGDDTSDRPARPPCRSSFPAGTPVLMADGSVVPIEDVDVGDRVMAADERRGLWAPRPVLDQWSDVHYGSMGTVTLRDGGTVSGTDDHRFWVASDGAWVELADLEPGDLLLTPDGVTEVAAVDLDPWATTLVWELNVSIDHTFAVKAGTEEVLVHNGCGDPPSADSIRRKRDNDEEFAALGIPDQDILDAWDRYDGDLTADEWLDRYVTIRKNHGRGSQFELDALESLGIDDVDKTMYTRIDPETGRARDFIPDHSEVMDDGTLRFVEAKNLDATTLQPSSNAGEMLRYLMDQDGSRQMDLVVNGDTTVLSDSMKQLIDRARQRGVVVNILPEGVYPPGS